MISDSNGTTTSKHVLIKNCSTETSINQSPLRLSDEKQTFGRSRVPRTDLSFQQKYICAKRGRGAFVDPWVVLLILNTPTICTFQFTRTKIQSILFSQINKVAQNKTQSIIILGTVPSQIWAVGKNEKLETFKLESLKWESFQCSK